jgi:ElaB/YqjD/DUF883 family membrane-anchored ribosome-binding protein
MHMSTQFAETSTEPSTTDQAKEKAQATAQDAKQKAGSQLRSQVDQRSTDAGHRVAGVASDARAVSQTLRDQGKDQPARLAEQAADRVERLGDYLKESDADRILGDIEDFGRKRPWAVVAGGVALGLVASRFLKASSIERYEQRSSGRLPEPVAAPAQPIAAPTQPVAAPAQPSFDPSR